MIKKYIKQAPIRTFLSLIQIDHSIQKLKKERQKARSFIWEKYFHIIQQEHITGFSPIQLVSELMDTHNSLFFPRNRKTKRTDGLEQKNKFMEDHCRAFGIDPSNVDFIDFIAYEGNGTLVGYTKTIFSKLNFQRVSDVIYVSPNINRLAFKVAFYHELGHVFANHCGILNRIKSISQKKFINFYKINCFQEFMADALVGLTSFTAAQDNLKFSIEYVDYGNTGGYYLSAHNLFILHADIGLLHGITIQSCFNQCENNVQEKLDLLLKIYYDADKNFFIQDNNYSVPRFYQTSCLIFLKNKELIYLVKKF